jgi:hypothetical protein
MDSPHPLAEPRAITSLKLTNKNDFVIEDRFDGVPYTFHPNTPVSIPADAALHMLGWFPGVDLKIVANHVAKRWGWNTPDLVKSKEASKFFDNLDFKAISYKLVEVVQTDKGEAA